MKIIKGIFEISGWFLGNANLGGPLQIAIKGYSDEKIDLHYHISTYEYFIILNGKVCITVENIDYELTEGTVFVVEPGEKHLLKDKSSDLKYLIVMDMFRENDKVILSNVSQN